MNAGTTNAGTTRPGPVDRVLRTVENAAAAVGLTGVVVTVALIVIDVALRYLVGAPLSWSVGFVGDYALVGLFFLGLSYTVREGAHVRIDLVHKRLGPAGRRMLAVTGSALTAVFLALVGYGGLLLTAGALRHGDVPARRGLGAVVAGVDLGGAGTDRRGARGAPEPAHAGPRPARPRARRPRHPLHPGRGGDRLMVLAGVLVLLFVLLLARVPVGVAIG